MERIQKGFEITRYFVNDMWDYIHLISHGCTKFVDPSEEVNHRELNYLILQVCNYYYIYDTREWKRPLLEALENNQELPTTTEGRTIPAAGDGCASNYDVIDNMGDFSMPHYETMENLWKEINKSYTVQMTTQTLKDTKDGLRAETRSARKSKRSRL